MRGAEDAASPSVASEAFESEAARRDLVHANRLALLGRSVATIVHEALQPVASVATRGQAALRWLRRDSPDVPAAIAALEALVENALRAGAVLTEVRSMASPTAKPRQPLSILTMLRDTLQWLDQELRQNQVTVWVDAPGDDVFVLGERVPLQQVLANLVINGIEAMTGNAAATRHLSIGLSVEGSHAVIAVSDSGCGFDAAAASRLFDAFYTTKRDGMGIGLATCRRIVTDHEGSLAAERRPEGGARFVVRLPCMTARHAACCAAAR
ncbi:Histidine kinase-, DNA gyrase B-, and HSP90-like ATPase [Cupriavidus sp. YR651]|uniref:sensor histidine kinase n=1 Tax=Cupriavidus sp. YR651 TaxID=1855315 RepID=UPI000886E350|nr:ATP-binding protein [Cupriavidus sp. YR651]SDC89073.1 Histidine kinase-, DNA gyrase B-, and HSP90-like ATPase [Cupriavidus sp. YR651]